MSVKVRDALYGLVGFALVGVAGWLLFLMLGGFFKSGFEVTANFERAGQLLRQGSDVKLRGALVGEVTHVDVSDPSRALVSMRIFPEDVDVVPADVRAAIRAKTLFGEKFIELQIPEDASERQIAAGDVIPRERTVEPIEVETILEKAVPILVAIDPENLSAALRALVQGFAGNEQALRRATDQGLIALRGTEETLPNLERNLVHLRNFSEALDASDERLLDALRGLEQVGAAVRRARGDIPEALDNLTGLTRDLADISEARFGDLVDLAEEGTPILEFVRSKAPELPGIVANLEGFLANWVVDLSAGPYWKILQSPDSTDAQPYGPGEEPAPEGSSAAQRADLLRRLAGLEPEAPAEDVGLGDILTSPLEVDDIVGMLPGTAEQGVGAG